LASSGKPRRGRPIKPADVKLDVDRPLDRQSRVPLYFQLGAALRERLVTGSWAPGSRFPTEREIGEGYDVSRSVIRRAMALLVSDGLIEMKRGAGAYVAPPRRKIRPLGLLEALVAPPRGLAVRVRTARNESAKEGVARLLGLATPRSQVTHATALFEIEDEPVCLLDSYVPTDAAPWLLAAMKEVRRGRFPTPPAGLRLSRAEIGIELSFYSAWGGPQLGATPGEPAQIGQLVQFGSTSGRGKERRLEFSHLVFRANRAHLTFDSD
jgi:DNA-binding GntR family transcriptional regulator